MSSSDSFLKFFSHKKIIVLAAVAVFALAARAQTLTKKEKPYALLYGTVWSPDDRPLPLVTVHVRCVGDRKARWTLVSDARGEFAQRVPAGKMDYVAWADLKDKRGSQHVETKVHVENDERVDFGLHLTQ